MIRYLPHGPDRYWKAQIARRGLYCLWATRLIGRYYWVRPITYRNGHAR